MGNKILKLQQQQPNSKIDSMGNKILKLQQQQEEETFTCEICIQPVALFRKFNNNYKCVHPFCTDCIKKYIQIKVEEEHVSDIKCPAINCKHSLQILSCRFIITKQVFNKWCDALCESAVVGFSRVYCPNNKCRELILAECGDSFDGCLKRCVCPNCKKPFCFWCKVPWHVGHNLCRYKIDKNDAAFNSVFKRNKWKRCPACGHCIERVGGCSTVKCRCEMKFNYNDEIIVRDVGLG